MARGGRIFGGNAARTGSDTGSDTLEAAILRASARGPGARTRAEIVPPSGRHLVLPSTSGTVLAVDVDALVALAATWLSVGLASAEPRPDVATLAAVGAPPRLRRRVVASQAAVIGVPLMVSIAGAGAHAVWPTPDGITAGHLIEFHAAHRARAVHA